MSIDICYMPVCEHSAYDIFLFVIRDNSGAIPGPLKTSTKNGAPEKVKGITASTSAKRKLTVYDLRLLGLVFFLLAKTSFALSETLNASFNPFISIHSAIPVSSISLSTSSTPNGVLCERRANSRR
ncbi:hypothetical protein BDN70DRAFT_886707, partial [Pholiota conissans]